MTASTVALLVAAGVVAIGDWAAVHLRLFRVEYVLKPLTLVLLVAAAVTADLGNAKAWVVAALVLGLLGDVGLLRSDGGTDAPFLAGLVAFLLGDVAYLVAFVVVGVRGIDLLAGLLIAVGVAALALPPVLRGAARASGRAFAAVVAGYTTLLAAMTTLAVGTGLLATAAGGALFLVSDTVLARQRFVARIRHGDLAVIVTYHLAQGLILIGLIGAA